MAEKASQLQVQGEGGVEAVPPPPPPPPHPHPNRLSFNKLRPKKRKRSADPAVLTLPRSTQTDTPKGGLTFLSELLASRKRKRDGLTSSSNAGIEDFPSPHEDLGTPLGDYPGSVEVLKIGELKKTSCSKKKGSEPGPVRQRRFRLTSDSLEYFQHFSQLKVRRSFPLTSIEGIEYSPDKEGGTGPYAFNVYFTSYIMTLEAETKEDASDWVTKITEAWNKWQVTSSILNRRASEQQLQGDTLPQPAAPPPPSSAEGGPVTPQDDDVFPPTAVTKGERKQSAGDVVPADRQRSFSVGVLRRDSSQVELGTYDRRYKFNRQAFRLQNLAHLTPRLQKTTGQVYDDKSTYDRLHDNVAMIKYPRRRWSIPSEKIFKVDKDNLQVMWRRNQTSKFNLSNTLSLFRILEIREGQQTEKFDRFPYEEVKDQSFSLVYESVAGKYVRLNSLDVICDQPKNFRDWIDGLRALVPGPQCSLFPHRYDNTDPSILWLKQLWTCSQVDHEMKERDAIEMVKALKPSIVHEDARRIVKAAHQHQLKQTSHHGYAIRWDAFVLAFNLICTATLSRAANRLYRIFSQYAKTYPKLGLTLDELRVLLINECEWEPRMCTRNDLQLLMHHHDYHHRAFKKYASENKPLDYQISFKLLSFAGFLSFLRSKDNSAVNLEHDSVCQDMTQPLSHYFINSSHNTYLEGDQLKGKSSNDAYVRALLQSSRCIEIDCWDDTLNVTGYGEPIIYHGFTLTTKLPFREVIQTIREYAFQTSIYPIIISIENHCSATQQAKMARIFSAVMGDVVVRENLVEKEDWRDRLPSPQELQGKIILKGSFKEAKKPKKPRVRPEAASVASPQHPSSASATPTHSTTPSRVTSVTSMGSVSSQESSIGRKPSMEGPAPPTTSINSNPDDRRSPSPLPSPTERTSSISFAFSEPYNRSSIRRLKREAREGGGDEELVEDDQELVFEETAQDLQQLIVYCRSVRIKPWDWNKQRKTTVSEMFSLGEPSAYKRCEEFPREVLACTERQLVRTYPKGSRFDSSNYDPIALWNCGIQMVALNYQYPDIYMHLNQGFFRLNGGCGYILKPAVMRKVDPGNADPPYLPTMEYPHPEVPTVEFEIELLSGQRLCFFNKKCTSINVDIHTYGIPKDSGRMQSAVHTDSFWPQWPEGTYTYQKTILMPELCLVYFRVEVTLKGLGKQQLYGQNCIPLISLMPGIKFIPMRTLAGALIPESGLFVRIKKRQDRRRKHSLQHQQQVDEDIFAEQEWAAGVDVGESLNPSLFRSKLQRQRELESSGTLGSSRSNSRPVSSPSNLDYLASIPEEKHGEEEETEAFVSKVTKEKQLEIIAEVYEGESASAYPARGAEAKMGTASKMGVDDTDAPSYPVRQKEFVFSIQPSLDSQPETVEGVVTMSFDNEPESEFNLEFSLPDDTDVV